MKQLQKRPRNTIQDIQEELNRLMEETFGEFGQFEQRLSTQITSWRPAIELFEKDGNLLLRAELPGLEKDDINIEISNNNLILSGEAKEKEEEKGQNYYKSELRYGKFLRSINLPLDINKDKIKANFKNGILTIDMPKTEEEKQKKLKIKIES